MAGNKKPKRKYKPKPMLVDPVGWVVQGFRPLAAVDGGDQAVVLKAKNHAALDAILKGEATWKHADTLVAAINMTESLLFTANLGDEYKPQIREASDAIHQMAERGLRTGRYLFTGPEMQKVKLAWEIHDAQLDICTVRELEHALKHVTTLQAEGKVKRIALPAALPIAA